MFGLQGGSAPAAPALFQGLEEGQMGHHSLPHSIGIPQQQMMLPQHQQADMQHLMAPATLPMPDAGPAGLHVSGPAFSGVEVHTSNMSIADDLLGIPGMGGTTGGMISLSDLQPGIPQSPIPGLPTQGIESLPTALQQDAAFVQAVQAQQVATAAIAALRVAKALISASSPGIVPGMTSGRPSDSLFVNQRVLIQDSSKKANPRSSGQEAVVVNILGNEWVVVKMAAGEHIRVARRNVIPISNEPVHLSQDLMDADFLDDVDDILMGRDDSLHMLDPSVIHGHGADPMKGGSSHNVHTGGQDIMTLSLPDASQLSMPASQRERPSEPSVSPEERAALAVRVKKDVLQIEANVPWVLAKLSWQVSRKRWRQSIKACRSGQELVPLLAAFNAALHRNTPRPGAGGGSRGSRAGGMALLLEALAAEISAGRETHRMLDARWDEARADIEAWLELEGANRLAAMCEPVAKAVVALEKAAEEGEEALHQVPLEALLGNSSAGMAVLRDVLERERSDLLSGKAPSCGQAEELSFAQALGSDGWSLYPGDEEGKVSDEGETTDVDDMDHVELM